MKINKDLIISDTTTSLGGVVTSLNNLSTSVNNLSIDYIVEQGVNNSWNYRKWASGLAECWQNIACSGLTLTSSSYGTYYSSTAGYKTVTFPSSLFKTVTSVSCSTGNGTHSSGVFVYKANITSTTQCTIEFRAHASCSDVSCPAFVHAYGTWK